MSTHRLATPPVEAAAGAVRVAILLHHPAHYLSPALRALGELAPVAARTYYWHADTAGLTDPGFGRAIRWATDLHSGYDWWSPPSDLPGWRRRLAIWQALAADPPSVILSFGWFSPVARLGILFARTTGTPLLFYGDSNARDRPPHGLLDPRRRAVTLLLRCGAGAITTGCANHDFYRARGIPAARLHPGVLPVDVEPFAAAARARADPDPGRPLILGFAGKLLEHKGIDDLIEAAAGLPRDRSWQLWLIGEGPRRDTLDALVHRHGLASRVRFLGFRNSDQMPGLMAAIDVFVLASHREPRGLVVVEAMAAGAAAVVSSATGVWGPDDVVVPEHSGLVFPVGDVGALTRCLLRLLDEPALRARLAAQGGIRARACGPREFAATTVAALVATTGNHGHAVQS